MKRLVTLAGVCALLGLIVSPAALAAEDSAAPPAQLGQLKARALGEIQQARAVVQETVYPPATDVSVFISVYVDSFVLEQVTVAIDGRNRARLQFGPAESAALHENGLLQRVLRTNIPPGPHHLALQFQGRLEFSDPDDPPLPGAIALDFTKGPKPQALILPVAPAALRRHRIFHHEKTWHWQQEAEDPRLGTARFLRATGRPFAAMLELLDMDNATPPGELPAIYFVLLAHSYLDFGMEDAAQAALAKYVQSGAARRPFEGVRLRVAQTAYQRGLLDTARRRLGQINKSYLSPIQLVHWQSILSRVQLAEGQYSGAVATLTRAGNALEVITEVDTKENQSLTMRYNLAVAMLKDGAVAKGRTLLDRLARRRCFTDFDRALRDLANVTLGFQLLASEQGATAKAIFQRVPLHGPFSEIALLGLARAELTPAGTRQSRVPIGDEPGPGVYGLRNPDAGRLNREDTPARFHTGGFNQVEFARFPMADIEDDEQAAQKRALVALKALAERDPLAPAVQEALVTIPYLLEQLQAYGAAQKQYVRAAQTLRQARAQIAEQIDRLNNGGAPGAAAARADSSIAVGTWWRQQQLSGLPTGLRWMQRLLASNPADARFANMLALSQMRHALATRPEVPARLSYATGGAQGWRARTVAARSATNLQQALGQAIAAQRAQLRGLALAALKAQRKRIDKYLVTAYNGVTRMYLLPQLQAQKKTADEAATTRKKTPAPAAKAVSGESP